MMHSCKSPRAQRYDYRSSGCYFVTICTKQRVHYFGKVVDGQMELNALGWWCTQHRQQIPTHYPHVVCDEFICMSNHIHGIIIIGESVGTQFFASGISNNIISRTDENPSLPSPQSKKSLPIPKPSCASGSLGAIIRGFKIGITKYANTHNIPFARQGRYHDRTNFFKKLALKLYKSFSIVRDQHAYEHIKYYIQQNPQNRKKDCFSEETHYS